MSSGCSALCLGAATHQAAAAAQRFNHTQAHDTVGKVDAGQLCELSHCCCCQAVKAAAAELQPAQPLHQWQVLRVWYLCKPVARIVVPITASRKVR